MLVSPQRSSTGGWHIFPIFCFFRLIFFSSMARPQGNFKRYSLLVYNQEFYWLPLSWRIALKIRQADLYCRTKRKTSANLDTRQNYPRFLFLGQDNRRITEKLSLCPRLVECLELSAGSKNRKYSLCPQFFSGDHCFQERRWHSSAREKARR